MDTKHFNAEAAAGESISARSDLPGHSFVRTRPDRLSRRLV